MTAASASATTATLRRSSSLSDNILTGVADPSPVVTQLELVDPRAEGIVPARESRVPRWLQRLIGPVVLLVVWQALSMAQLFDPRTTPSPLIVLNTAITLMSSGELQAHLQASLGRVLHGLAIGVSLGVVGALLAGLA